MRSNHVRKMVYELLGKQDDQAPLHIQTVKITEAAHAKLRALADMTARSKTPLAADLLMAAIDDAIEALPNEALDEAAADKLRGVTKRWGRSPVEFNGVTYDLEPRGMRDIVLERADLYLVHDRNGRWDAAEAVSQNGAHE